MTDWIDVLNMAFWLFFFHLTVPFSGGHAADIRPAALLNIAGRDPLRAATWCGRGRLQFVRRPPGAAVGLLPAPQCADSRRPLGAAVRRVQLSPAGR